MPPALPVPILKKVGSCANAVPADNVAAAVRFLAWLQTYWDGEIADPQERLKFVLASYNTGHGHLGWTLSAATAQGVADSIDAARMKNAA